MTCHCCSCHPEEKEENRRKKKCAEEKSEKKEFLQNLFFLVTGILLLLAAFLLNYFDSSAFQEMDWSFFANSSFYSSLSFISFVFYTVDYLLLSYTLVTKMIDEIRERNYINEFTLMLVATVGAYAICEFPEAVLVVLFSIVGEMLEDYATEKSSKSIKSLVNSMPLYAHLVQEDGKIVDKDPESVPIGSLLEIRPGEKIALDGIVVHGKTTMDLSSINGESLPKDIQEGDRVFSGSINLSSAITIKTEKVYEDSTLSKIMALVDSEQGKKAKSEKFITRFSKFYTPIVVLIAIVVFLIGYGLSGFVWAGEGGGEEWLYRALSILLISCPCALVISVPISFFAGIGTASRFGVLIKGSLPLENLAKSNVFFFDKTGTLTKGNFVLDNKVSYEFLSLAASLESKSTHPLGKAIVNAYSGPIRPVENFLNVPGYGIQGEIDNHVYLIGSRKFLLQNGVSDFPEESTPFKVLYLAEKNGRKLSSFIVVDQIKDGAAEAIKGLKSQKVETTAMLSGDDEKIAKAVKERVGLDEYHGELLPEQKLQHIKSAMEKNRVTYVGDGINDSPSLLASDVGVAMGALGSDAAIEASDVVVMDDDLRKLAEGRRLARRTMWNVVIGVTFAIVVKVLIMVLVALGYCGNFAMILGTFSDTGIMAICVLHAMSIMLYKPKYISSLKK